MKKPNAWIVASKDRGRKKIYRGKETGNRRVYLNDGDEFQIELYNPTPFNVMAKIWLDGKAISNKGILVRPGERRYLERHLDENKSFKFDTYNVENTSDSREAISNNGKLEVKFYNEKQINSFEFNTWCGCCGSTNCWGNCNTGTYYGGYGGTLTLNNNSVTTTSTGEFDVNSTPTAFTSNLQSNQTRMAKNNTKSLETGQVGKGKSTNQKFKNIDMDFENYTVNTVTYWLMPESRRVLTKKDINKKQKQYFNDGVSDLPKKSKYVSSESDKIDMLYNALNKLKELKDNGLITESEFNDKRKKLMKENA